MGNTTEVKTVFTIDLKPFADGLKTMLGMTSATAAQIKPILNFDVKAPDFSAIDSQLKGLADRTAEYLESQQQVIPVVDNATGEEKKHGDAADESAKKVFRKAESLGHVKREALESFGAISFLALGIVQLSSSVSGGSKNLEKLSNSLSSGISAGFGFAGMISIIAPSAGTAAAGVGILVASVISLMKYFDDSEAEQRRMQSTLEDVRKSMRGAATEDLIAYRNNLIASAQAAKETAATYDKIKQSLPTGDLVGRAAMYTEYTKQMARAAEFKQLASVVDNEMESRSKTVGEAKLFVKQAEIAATKNQFEQQRKTAKAAYEKELEEYKGHANALEAARKKHEMAVVKIAEEESRFNQQIADQKYEADLNQIRLQGIESGETQERIDLQILESRSRHYGEQYNKLLALGSNVSTEQIQQRAQLEATLTQIEFEKAQKRIEIRQTEFESKLRLSEIEGQRQIAQYKTEGYERGDSPEKIATGVLALERSQTQGVIAEYNKRIASGEKLNQQELERVAQLNSRLIELSAEEARSEIEAREKLKDTRKSIGELELKNRNDEQSEELAQVDNWLEKVKQTYGVTAEDINRAEKAAADRRVQIAKEAEERKRQAILEGALGIANDLASASNSLLSITQEQTSREVGEEKKRRQAALDTEKEKRLAAAKSSTDRDKIEKDYAAKKEALDIEMNNKAKAANADAFAIQKTFSIVQATIATYEAATKAYNALVGIPIVGPGLAVAAAAAAIAAGLANVAVIQSQEVPGLAEGGRLRKGQAGYIEGWANEIVAPEKTFIQVFREDLMPELMKVMLSERPRDILFPRVKESALEAPAKLLNQNTRNTVLEVLQTQLSISNQPGSNTESVRNAIHIHVEIKNFIGTKEFVKTALKPAIEGVMRELGASSINDVFINKFK